MKLKKAPMPSEITDQQIRAHFWRDPQTIAVTVKRDGRVIVRAYQTGGGGFPVNRVMGLRHDIAFDVAQALFDAQD